MVAEVIVLADYRAQHAQVTVQVSVDPLAVWWAWYGYLTGYSAKAEAADPPAKVVYLR